MMRYSFNQNREPVALAQGYDINASYKDLCIVCNAIRYLKTERAIEVLDSIIKMEKPIKFTKFNKYMGSRHELGGQKGAYPVKAAKEVKAIVINAVANSKTKGLFQDSLYVVHASANKTNIMKRRPSKGSWTWGRGMYGMSASTASNLEHAKIEIGVAEGDDKKLSENTRRLVIVRNPIREIKSKPKEKKEPAKHEAKKEKK